MDLTVFHWYHNNSKSCTWWIFQRKLCNCYIPPIQSNFQTQPKSNGSKWRKIGIRLILQSSCVSSFRVHKLKWIARIRVSSREWLPQWIRTFFRSSFKDPNNLIKIKHRARSSEISQSSSLNTCSNFPLCTYIHMSLFYCFDFCHFYCISFNNQNYEKLVK